MTKRTLLFSSVPAMPIMVSRSNAASVLIDLRPSVKKSRMADRILQPLLGLLQHRHR